MPAHIRLLAAGAAAIVASLLLAAAAVAAPVIRVSGNQLVNGAGTPLRIAGVNRSGSEYACAQGWGLFDGPVDDTAISAIAAFGANAVRVPLNEDCWLGINGVPAAYSGANYQSAIWSLVQRLEAHGLAVILDLHWGASGNQLALGQEMAPDADHATAFWSSVAAQYKNVGGVAFDLFNEPHDISWACWRNGCTTSTGYQATGMQQLINAVRGAGATQPVIAEGLNWGGDLSGWLANAPTDPAGQLVAGWHIYNFSGCNTTSCWDSTIAPVAQRVPVLATEVGENDCSGSFLNTLLPWADSHDIGYLAWAWNTSSCTAGPSLITSYSGALTAYGAAYQAHIKAASAAPLDPAARFDFEDGTTQGWGVWWGSTLSVANETGTALSGTHGLALSVSGTGYPAAGVTSGIPDVGAGTTVTYHVWAPSGVQASVSPAFADSNWTTTVLSGQSLQPGWNTVTFTVPVTTNGVRQLGLQVDDSAGWSGRLVLDDIAWHNQPLDPAARFDFESSNADGWSVWWGANLSVSAESGTAYSGSGGLALAVSGPGYPAAGVRTSGLAGLGPGTPVTYHVWAPAGEQASVSPMMLDSNWKATVMPAQALAPGWTTVSFTIPSTIGALNVLGLQVDEPGAWTGRLVLDDVTWSAPGSGSATAAATSATSAITSSTTAVTTSSTGRQALAGAVHRTMLRRARARGRDRTHTRVRGHAKARHRSRAPRGRSLRPARRTCRCGCRPGRGRRC
ncbi:MAG TPA: cellulase family glycosylhydrolase [Solirubrobacteraceae bacterium]|nr:cellulase family glycosylhydrolase [Solirubrobacteraceae bacterium]